MKFKSGVNAEGVQRETWYALGVAAAIYAYYDYPFVVTSLTDGVHPDKKNIHGRGYAADIRTRQIPDLLLKSMVKELTAVLYAVGYDIVLETDHLHIEFDPKPGRSDWTTVIA